MEYKNRKDYWNSSYLSYLKERVKETFEDSGMSRVVENDAKIESEEYYVELFEKFPLRSGNVLDVGCAWGRFFDIFIDKRLEIYGIDISAAMIDEAHRLYSKNPLVREMVEGEAESLPFEDAMFHNLTCFGTFDATYQHIALKEYIRVLKIGGLLYLTGKNTNYLDDDELALNAEIGARGKGHPNYFTDTQALINKLKENGHKMISMFYFPRRGDFALNKHSVEMPSKFYEWLLIIEKGSDNIQFEPFSSECSETFVNRKDTL